MTATPAISCYLDVPGFLASQPSLATATLLGGNTTLASASLVGATSLSVGNTSGFQSGQLIYILDGPNTELVLAATPAYTSASALLLASPGCAYAHSAGASVSSGGSAGALGDTLLAASSWVEEYCGQGHPGSRSLYSATHTENLPMPTTRAFIDRAYGLLVRPSWFPVTTISAVAIAQSPTMTAAFDATQAMIDPSGQSVTIPQLYPLVGGQPSLASFTYYNRGSPQWASITYAAGFPVGVGQLPWQFLRAVSFVAREFLAYARNPTGAAMIRQGDVQLMQRLRGSGGKETSADTIFMVQARQLLQPYKALWV